MPDFYYYLYDIHGSYGADNTGWYIYEDNNWKYYCSEESPMLGYELENSKEDYKIGRNFSDPSRNQDSFSYKWYLNDFSTTQWYSSYERNNDRHEEHMEEVRANSSSSDSDYDWSSSDSWDSGSTDWDSDW